MHHVHHVVILSGHFEIFLHLEATSESVVNSNELNTCTHRTDNTVLALSMCVPQSLSVPTIHSIFHEVIISRKGIGTTLRKRYRSLP